ncbi:glycosyltransferase [Algoriphagus aquimarinus]|uniref:glycosyltransferase n=1 Tax=Algoriphagus aquimarinus TaxID=237018 RepID=UPI0030DBCC21|tara:strand:- start:1076 stop:1972 length:897 start_codon:yes stop_codon:yes gene_type:complete
MKITLETIGAVIVTYRRPLQLSKTLNAILDQGILSENIWVINNDPDDRLEMFQSEHRFRTINFHHNKENIASAGGFALGMAKIQSSGLGWAWLFNDDSRPISGSLESIMNHDIELEKGKIGMVKLANLNSTGEAILQNWRGRRVPSYVPVSQQLIETDLVTFDGCLIAAEMIQDIGTCDPSYFMGTYEFDYCLKAKDHGYKIYTIPNGMIEDEKTGSVGGTPPWRQYYNTRNHLHLGIKRRDLGIIWAWIVREAKFTYSILRFQDQKAERLRMKSIASLHAVIGKRGKFYDPNKYKSN